MVLSDAFISNNVSISLFVSVELFPFFIASIFGLNAEIFFKSPLMDVIAFAVVASLQREFHVLAQRPPFSFIDFSNHSNFIIKRDRRISIF